MYLPTATVPFTGKPTRVGRKMTARAGKMFLPRARGTHPGHPMRPLRPGRLREAARGIPAPITDQIPAIVPIVPASTGKVIPDNVLRREATSTARTVHAAEYREEEGAGVKPGECRLFCSPAGDRNLADVQYPGRFVVKELLFAIAAAFQQLLETFAACVHHEGSHAFLFRNI